MTAFFSHIKYTYKYAKLTLLSLLSDGFSCLQCGHKGSNCCWSRLLTSEHQTSLPAMMSCTLSVTPFRFLQLLLPFRQANYTIPMLKDTKMLVIYMSRSTLIRHKIMTTDMELNIADYLFITAQWRQRQDYKDCYLLIYFTR